jgi:hypothetical protein
MGASVWPLRPERLEPAAQILRPTPMSLYYRIFLGCMALVGAGFTLRALQTGIVYSSRWVSYNRDTQFGMYALVVFGNLVGITVCLWLAAGYTGQDFWAPLGLAGLPAFFQH